MRSIQRFFSFLLYFFLSKKANDELRQYYKAIDKSVAVTHSDLSGIITYVNDTFSEMTGYTQEEILGKPHKIFRFKGVSKEIFREMWNTIQQGKTWNSSLPMLAKSGDILIFDTTIVPIINPLGRVTKYVSVRTNVTELSKLECDLHNTQASIIKALGEIAESNSLETAGHVVRVSSYTKLLATLYGLEQDEIEILTLASQLHDIGKISIPESILGKPGKLTEEEFEVMKQHAQFGYDLLKGSELPILLAASVISRDHHENWDGSGYPNGVSGNDIHIYGRIVALADVIDALCMKRVYKDAWSEEDAFKFIVEQKEIKFDPKLVNLLINNFETFKKVKDKHNRSQTITRMDVPNMKTIESMCAIDHPDISDLESKNTKRTK